MHALLLRAPPRSTAPAALEPVDLPRPDPADDEILVRVAVCGVCRTDLDLADGRLVAPDYPVIPGHQIVGEVAGVGRAVTSFRDGDRVGIAWIHHACGHCAWCTRGEENLCPRFRSTGCDANGGYAAYATVPADFAYAIPATIADAEAAPLLCAGAIGWRSLRLAAIRDGDPIGLTGFGASAHLVCQLARLRYPSSLIYFFARSSGERAFARELGAAWAGDTSERPPESMRAIIDTTPAWKPVIEALANLLPGGRLVINAIRKSDADQLELLRLDYARHLWLEREIKSVANVTRADVREMLDFAAEHALRPTVTLLPLERANEALASLRGATEIRGATVLQVRASTAATS